MNIDVQVYDSGIILSNGDIRIRLRGRHLPDIRGRSRHDQLAILLEALPIADIEHLREIGLFEPHSLRKGISVRSAQVSCIAKLFTPISGHCGLFLITLFSIFILIFQIIINKIGDQTTSPITESMFYILVVPPTCILSGILHEIGHASSCTRFTGSSGAIYVSWLPLNIYTDVTSSQDLPFKYKFCVIFAGVAFQMLIIPIAFLLTLLIPLLQRPLLFSITLVFFHALATLIPLAPNDGSAICRELERTVKWRGVNAYVTRHSGAFRHAHRLIVFAGLAASLLVVMH